VSAVHLVRNPSVSVPAPGAKHSSAAAVKIVAKFCVNAAEIKTAGSQTARSAVNVAGENWKLSATVVSLVKS
jgi:hypothetical protein